MTRRQLPISGSAHKARNGRRPLRAATAIARSARPRRWLADREAELLPVPYFHVVFTLPGKLRDIAWQNKRVVYDLLFRAAAETLTTIAADPKHLGARIGLTAVLHTWGSALTHHPHVHIIVPGGCLTPDGSRWIACKRGFFLPVRVLSRLFRRLFLEGIAAKPQTKMQIAEILSVKDDEVVARISKLMSFQCVVRAQRDNYEKYSVNADLKFLASSFAQRSVGIVREIKAAIAKMPDEITMDCSKNEFDIAAIFQQYLADERFVEARDFMKDSLRQWPNSNLLNFHYAKFLGEHRGTLEEAIVILERLRLAGVDSSEVLRLLMMYNARLEVPNFEQASFYAKKLEERGFASDDHRVDAAETLVQWGTNLKLKFDLDPLKDRLRQQKYKELADESLEILSSCLDKDNHRWKFIAAECYFLKWDYDAAKRHVDKALEALPPGSYLEASYKKLRDEILRKWVLHRKRR